MTIQGMKDRIKKLREMEQNAVYLKDSFEILNLIRMYQRIIRKAQKA